MTKSRWAIPLLCLILCVAGGLPLVARGVCGDPASNRVEPARSVSTPTPSPDGIDWSEHFFLPDRHLKMKLATYRPMIVQEDVDEPQGSLTDRPSPRPLPEAEGADSRYLRAGPWEVGLTNATVKGGGLLIVSLFWLLFLVILRRVFDKWFDADVYTKPWQSTVVIMTLLGCTAWILVSVIS